MGSDAELLADMATYWTAYDLLSTEAERAALQRAFLLAHGGKIVVKNGFRELEGGVFPVRV